MSSKRTVRIQVQGHIGTHTSSGLFTPHLSFSKTILTDDAVHLVVDEKPEFDEPLISLCVLLQVVGILVGVSIVVLVTSPLLLLASPCILCCLCKPCRGMKKKKKKKKENSQPDSSAS